MSIVKEQVLVLVLPILSKSIINNPDFVGIISRCHSETVIYTMSGKKGTNSTVF